jgi:hypothetical protein
MHHGRRGPWFLSAAPVYLPQLVELPASCGLSAVRTLDVDGLPTGSPKSRQNRAKTVPKPCVHARDIRTFSERRGIAPAERGIAPAKTLTYRAHVPQRLASLHKYALPGSAMGS